MASIHSSLGARLRRIPKKRIRKVASQVFATLLIIPGAILFLAPFIWMLSTSLKDPRLTYIFPPQIIPDPFRWDNYVRVFERLPFQLYGWNTVRMTFLCVLGQLLSASVVAYGFARLRFPGRDLLFVVLLSTMMLPPQVTMIPSFLIYRYLGWIDTYYPLIVPDWLAGSPFTVFLLRQFISTLPVEMDEAAKIEGCGFFGIYWRIILPLIAPALAAVAIFVFMWAWNDIFYSLIYLNTQDKWTLALGLNFLRRTSPVGPMVLEVEIIMAGSIIVMLPCLLLFFFAQKYFIQGVVFTGVKG
ncbi:MAG: carbohydrate ABC transporter permease [Chloroflexi bacterium]|nr:carbohydrate ABC transporter permease [Chloroflexota bacterium]